MDIVKDCIDGLTAPYQVPDVLPIADRELPIDRASNPGSRISVGNFISQWLLNGDRLLTNDCLVFRT